MQTYKSLFVAPDKSLSHRALIFASLAEGVSKIYNVLLSEDVLCTLKILNQLGVKTQPTAENILKENFDFLEVHGVGLYGLKKSNDILYCGNSGTTMRLMLGVLSAQNFDSTLTGDDSLNKRPMARVINPLKETGARFEVIQKNDKRLITCCARSAENPVQAINYKSPVASAQVKTCLMLSGLFATDKTVVTEPYLSRNHSEILLRNQGCDIDISTQSDGMACITLTPPKTLKAFDFTVPADISSAAFFLVYGLLKKSSQLLLKNVNINPTRRGILDALLKMQANIEIVNPHTVCGEEVSDLKIQSSNLKNITIAGEWIPRLIDEIPILALAAVAAKGEFLVKDAKELRVKETDRILAIAKNLEKLGVKVKVFDDGFSLQGQSFQIPQKEILWETFHDHRIAMMGAIAKNVFDCDLVLDDAQCVETSFPNFFELLNECS